MELEEEKEELKESQEKHKERRCLEYALYQRELTEVGQQLEEVRFAGMKSMVDMMFSRLCRSKRIGRKRLTTPIGGVPNMQPEKTGGGAC